MPAKSQPERWRDEAHEALAKFSRAMDFFLFATAELVRLTEIHAPDDFNHCQVCKLPYPCPTMTVVHRIGAAWRELQQQTATDIQGGQ